MKKLFLVPLFLLCINELSAQVLKFDDYVSIHKPDNVTVRDTIIQNTKVVQFSSEADSYTFLLVRTEIVTKETEINILPYDNVSLEKTYHALVSGFNKTIRASGYTITDSAKVDFKGFVAFKVTANDIQDHKIAYESLFLILDKYAYDFSYMGPASQGDKSFDVFLNNISINSTSKASQITGKSHSYKMGYLAGKCLSVPLLLIVLFFVIRFIIKKMK
jgi:hypothetical protein